MTRPTHSQSQETLAPLCRCTVALYPDGAGLAGLGVTMNDESHAVDAAPTRVLLIEDDEHFREGLAGTLRLAGATVLDFGRAGAALRTLRDPGFDLVLTDLRLPDMDGLEVLAHCRAADAELPVVVMTGHGDVETAVCAIKQGAYDFIEKP